MEIDLIKYYHLISSAKQSDQPFPRYLTNKIGLWLSQM